MIKIGQYYFNPSNITWVIEREVHFNNGKSMTLTEPEIQDLFAHLFNEPRVESPILKAVAETKKDLATVTVVEEPLVIKKKVVKKK
jgi:hypothetical protein